VLVFGIRRATDLQLLEDVTDSPRLVVLVVQLGVAVEFDHELVIELLILEDSQFFPLRQDPCFNIFNHLI